MYLENELELKKAVLEELKYESNIKDSNIGISVNDDIVSLNGSVSTYADKLTVESVAKRLAGGRSFKDDVIVKIPESSRRTDHAIANSALDAIKWITTVPENTVKISVLDGWISLEGAVNEGHLRSAAEEAVRNLDGLKGVTNRIVIKPKVPVIKESTRS